MKDFIGNHKKLLIGIAVALVLLGGVTVFALSSMGSEDQSNSANSSYTVEYGNIESTVSGKGYVQSGNEVKIIAPVGVTVKEVLVKVGDTVGAGQALANIEPTSINGKLAEAQNRETEIQKQLDSTKLTTYERDALVGQRTEVRSYISQLKDLRNYPVITAPQNGVINNIYLIDGTPITVQNTMQSQNSSSDSSGTNNVSFVTPLVGSNAITYPQSVGFSQQQLNRLSYFSDSLLLVPFYHFLFNSKASPLNYTVNAQNAVINSKTISSSDIIELSDSTTPTENPNEEGNFVFENDKAYVNGRSDFVPDTDTSNADYERIEEELENEQKSGQQGQSTEDENKLPSDYFSTPGTSAASSGSSASSADIQQISDFITYDATAFKLGTLDQLMVNILVDERDILKIQPGQEAKVKLDAVPDEEFTGNISSISGTAQTSEGNSKYSVDVTLNTDRPLKSGMSANVTISTGNNQNVLIIPIEALQDQNNKKFVYTTEDEDGALGGEVDVTTGLSNQDYVEITGGLSPGQVIYYPKQNTSDDFTSELMSDGDEEESTGDSE